MRRDDYRNDASALCSVGMAGRESSSMYKVNVKFPITAGKVRLLMDQSRDSFKE